VRIDPRITWIERIQRRDFTAKKGFHRKGAKDAKYKRKEKKRKSLLAFSSLHLLFATALCGLCTFAVNLFSLLQSF